MVRRDSLWARYGSLAIPPPYIELENRKEIHITDLGARVTCKLMWYLSSPLGRGLQPAVLPTPLAIGQGVHIGLDAGYSGSTPAHRAEGHASASFDSSVAIPAFTKWLSKRKEQIELYTGPLWEHEKEKFSTIEVLSTTLLFHYGLWVNSKRLPLDENFEILGTEQKFKIPIPGTRNPPLAYAGRFDGLVREINTNNHYVLEFKTTRSLKNIEPIFRSLQPTAYLWAAQQVYGSKVNVVGVLYRILLKKIPDNPKPLMRGGFSRAKGIKSTVEWYRHCLRVMASSDAEGGVKGVSESGGLYKQYVQEAAPTLQMLKAKGENGFFLQRKFHKSTRQIEHTITVLREEGKQMAARRPLIYPVPGIHCSWCQFKDPCDLLARGYEEECEALLDAEYAPRDYWEDPE